MAGLIGHQSITKGLFDQMMGLEYQVKFEAWEAAKEAATAGAIAIKETIDTTPSSLAPGKDNRNYTYEMNQSVDARVRREGNTIHLRAGWLDNKQAYFLFQEDGATMPNGKVITPMHALMNGYAAMLAKLAEWGIKV